MCLSLFTSARPRQPTDFPQYPPTRKYRITGLLYQYQRFGFSSSAARSAFIAPIDKPHTITAARRQTIKTDDTAVKQSCGATSRSPGLRKNSGDQMNRRHGISHHNTASARRLPVPAARRNNITRTAAGIITEARGLIGNRCKVIGAAGVRTQAQRGRIARRRV